jgi:hypothetical protein
MSTKVSDKIAEELQQQLANEVSRLRDLAVRSTDALVVAKAIAASDKGVQHLLLEKLASGERLVEVFALQGASLSELQVFFRLVTSQPVGHLTDVGVLAFVSIAKGEVFGIVDDFVLQPERRVGRPFVTVEALKQAAQTAGASADDPVKPRAQAFFRSIGLGQFGGGGLRVTVDTVVDSDITSATYSPGPGGRYKADDTGKETVGDACDADFLA